MKKGNSWRPKGWWCPYIPRTITTDMGEEADYGNAFEAGADAMLEALEAERYKRVVALEPTWLQEWLKENYPEEEKRE